MADTPDLGFLFYDFSAEIGGFNRSDKTADNKSQKCVFSCCIWWEFEFVKPSQKESQGKSVTILRKSGRRKSRRKTHYYWVILFSPMRLFGPKTLELEL
jgi:hypothetical protein